VRLRKPSCIAWRIALAHPQKAERFNATARGVAPKTLISLRFECSKTSELAKLDNTFCASDNSR